MNTFADFSPEVSQQVTVKVLKKEKRKNRNGTVYYYMQCQDMAKKVATVLLWEDDYLNYRSELKNKTWVVIELLEYSEVYNNFTFGDFIHKADDPEPKPKKIDRELQKIMGSGKKDELLRIMGF